MTKEEIIRLMHEAVKDHSEYYVECGDPKGEDLEVFVKFAELVIAAEREACAVAAENLSTRDAYEIAHIIRARSNQSCTTKEPT